MSNGWLLWQRWEERAPRVLLAQRNAENLHAALLAVNEQKKLVRRLPGQEQVRDWIEQARQLPRVVTY